MQNATATLYCPKCQSLNSEFHKFCQQCRTQLPKFYLWAIGPGLKTCRVGDVLEDRYLLKSDRILLDTKPGLLVKSQPLVSKAIEPYLKLFPYRLHIPQVYGLVRPDEGQLEEILLLEQAPLSNWDLAGSAAAGDPSIGAAVPLIKAWSQANTLRQLNWLWQMAHLWQPLSSQNVASSLLQPELLRVEGSLVRLLELHLDEAEIPLAQLGQFWLEWVDGAQVAIASALEQLCQQMIQGQLRTAEQLVDQLDQWLALVGRFSSDTSRSPSAPQKEPQAESQFYQTEIITQIDQGPTRQRNEDACYPSEGVVATNPPHLTTICDGVGGHAGGAVASSLATAVVQQHIQSLGLEDSEPRTLMAKLETAICAANDQISQRNDSEQRQDRQRMGTTLVMALVRAPEIYIAHVGDSRAYWITRTGCYQVTLDDDIASREVRLGYTFYREALAQPASGSLIQALGMGPSTLLHPTVQRLILDEDCVFLLCSDGLSDYDRVEACWETEILPILDGKVTLAAASQRLIEIANQQNGHDNVTVSLVHCQVAAAAAAGMVSIPVPTEFEAPDSATFPLSDSNSDEAKTQILQSRRRPILRPLFTLCLIAGVSGLLAYFVMPQFLRLGPLASNSPVPVNPNSAPVSLAPSIAPAQLLTVGSKLQVKPSAPGSSGKQTVAPVLLSQPDNPRATKGVLLTGSILQVLRKQTFSDQQSWLRVQVCADPLAAPDPGATATEIPRTGPTPLGEKPPPASPGLAAEGSNQTPSPTRPSAAGTSGWIQEANLTAIATVLRPDRPSSCATRAQS